MKFSNREISISFKQSLRGKHLFIFGETSENLTELLLTIDAAKRSSVDEITVVLPVYGYGRQDKREGNRGCLGASMIAGVLQSMGIDRIITIDLHAEQIQGFFRGIPVEHINGKNIFIKDPKTFLEKIGSKFNLDMSKPFKIATPDVGGTNRAIRFATALGLQIVCVDKHRDAPGSIAYMKLISGDPSDCNIIIVDDMADTCGTLSKSTDLLKENGAVSVVALASHPVLSGKAKLNLETSKLNGIILSDTLNNEEFFTNLNFPYHIESCVDVLYEAISRVAQGKSISKLTNY